MKILLSFIQLFWVLVVAPLLAGVIQKTKALLQGRIGPRLFQPYYDLAKFFRKSAVFSEHTSWLTRLTPYIVITTTIVASIDRKSTRLNSSHVNTSYVALTSKKKNCKVPS